ncbi:MAG TPA: type II secretion system minor pseudopilin GspK [Paraburkholderia sp.]
MRIRFSRTRFSRTRLGRRAGLRRARDAKSQRGAAIITALLVVALSAILVAGMLWRQEVQVRRIENQRLIAQAQWVARGSLDWTRLVLRSEADTTAGITYLGGVWAMPVARTRLSDLLGQMGDSRDARQAEDTWIAGSVEDAQARFNIRNLVTNSAPGALQLNVTQIEAFARLLALVGLDGQLAKNAAVYLRSSLEYSATRFQTANPSGTTTTTSANGTTTTTQMTPQQMVGGAAGGATFTDNPGLSDDNSSATAPLIMTSVDSLLDVPGFTPQAVAKLRPFVTVLPTVTPINMNTASAEVISASVPGLDLSSAQALVSHRQTIFFRNLGDVQLALQASGMPDQVGLDSSQFDVNTSYFYIHERVTHERSEIDRTSLVWRDPMTHTTRIVRVHDEF